MKNKIAVSGGMALCLLLVAAGPTVPAANFEDVTVSSGIDAIYNTTASDVAVAWRDYNGDGWPDLFLGSHDIAKGIYIFRNEGNGTFSDPAFPDENALPMWWSGLWVDYDNDEHPDLFSSVANSHLIGYDGSTLSNQDSLLETFDWQSECSSWADFNGDGLLDFYRSGWETAPAGPYFPDAVFLRNPAAGFEVDWWQATEGDWQNGVGDRRPGRGVTSADFDEDGDIDVYVSNYRLAPNYLWLNDGTGQFTNVAHSYGVAGVDEGGVGVYAWGHSVGSCWGDLDNDGHLDLFVGNFSHAWQAGSPAVYYQDPPQFLRNRGPEGNWHFEIMPHIVVPNASTGWVQSAASPALADFDNDGDLDVFITAASGYYSGEQSRLFRNDGNWNFSEVSADHGLNIATSQTNFQAAWADYDNDGDLDLFTGRRLYRNPLDNGNHWLKLRLIGDGTNVNSDAIGAVVRIDLPGLGRLTRQVENATGWGNQNDIVLHFGLGAETGPVELQVYWPDQTGQTLQAAVDQSHTLRYDPEWTWPRPTAARSSWPLYR